ncbi:MAG: hypothetical protein LBB15_02075, partial [Puniceicoccales bacterium]|nr:hypothetical protein [Puniceicoccales bacterium]
IDDSAPAEGPSVRNRNPWEGGNTRHLTARDLNFSQFFKDTRVKCMNGFREIKKIFSQIKRSKLQIEASQVCRCKMLIT